MNQPSNTRGGGLQPPNERGGRLEIAPLGNFRVRRGMLGWFPAACGILLAVGLGLATETENTKVRFSVVSWDDGILTPMRFAKGEKGIMTHVPWMHRLGPFEYKGEMPIQFLEGAEEIDPDSGKSRKIMASVTIPGGMKEALLIFFKATEDSVPYRVVVVEDGLDEFPFGSYRLQNLTKYAISGRIGPKTFQLNSGEASVLRPPFQEIQDVEVQASYQSGERKVLFSETIWTFEPRLRKSVFIATPASGSEPEFRSISEYQPRAKKEVPQ